MPEILTDNLHRMAYATDAGAYRELPAGVAFPERESDIPSLIRTAQEKGIGLIPRAGGTSIAGQVTGPGIVVDVSRHLNRILEINPSERWARVQPGVVRDVLNKALAPYGLFFSPETSTSNRCCIGGMTGNNSCGSHSLVYGSTRHHVLQLKGYLSDGSPFDTAAAGSGKLETAIRAELLRWKDDKDIRSAIAAGYPDARILRRSCGYAIDEALQALDAPADGSDGMGEALCRLLCGSEGTLAFITEIKVSLDPLPEPPAMLLCAHCNSLETAFEANLTALRHSPSAVELMDGKILELAGDPIKPRPAALLISEFNGPEGEDAAKRLEAELLEAYPGTTFNRCHGDEVGKMWQLRKAGLGVLGRMKGDARPVGVIEDTAVAPERLPAYMRDFREMMSSLGLSCVYYGHIGSGELHLRPILNLKDAEGRRLFREVAERTAALVSRHKGCLSGEHGDGRLRGEFIPLVYGSECYALMKEVKRLFDPQGVFNPGKITDTPPMDSSLRVTENQRYTIEDEATGFRWRAAFDECTVPGASGVRSDAHALMCSIEQCNGAGDCRRPRGMGGNMCPVYRLTGDELDTTRARANVLRECLTNGAGLDSPELLEVLGSCLACKACKAECPSEVDMTRLRAEVLNLVHKRKGVPFRSLAVSRQPLVEAFGSMVRPLYNALAGWKPSANLIKKAVGFATERSIPALHPLHLRPSAEESPKKLILYVDEFTRREEPEIARAMAGLFEKLGYQILDIYYGVSGRAAISKGCLDYAARRARRNVEALAGRISPEIPLVGIEPSCILSFRDEYPDLVPPRLRDEARRLGANCLLYDEFIMREVRAGRISPDAFREDPVEIWLHGHCHQKALVGIGPTAEALRLLPGVKLEVIPSSCCGMAGSFGYEKEHYRRSLEIGEQILFPAVRKAVSGRAGKNGNAAGPAEGGHSGAAGNAAGPGEVPVLVAAPGTSCRHQIYDGTGVRAVHPVEILKKWLR